MATKKRKPAGISGLGTLEKTKASLRKEVSALKAKKSAERKKITDAQKAEKRKKQIVSDIQKLKNEAARLRGKKPSKKAAKR
jgi:uncharacterized protein YlxW (UPF0749 family)